MLPITCRHTDQSDSWRGTNGLRVFCRTCNEVRAVLTSGRGWYAPDGVGPFAGVNAADEYRRDRNLDGYVELR